MKISVIGCGYLGAVHAASMAHLGHEVIGVDCDEQWVARLSTGRAPFYEPRFEALLRAGLDSGRLRFTTDISQAASARMHFVCVGTPQRADSDSADLSAVNAAVGGLLEVLKPRADGAPHVIVGKSTVPVGTASVLSARIQQAMPDGAVTLVWNPEFLREGFAVQDTLEPDRIVYGLGVDSRATEGWVAMDEVYRTMLDRGTLRIVTDYATTELVKVAANSFLAMKISFINAMAEVCDATQGDVRVLAEAIGADERIGRLFLRAGVGYGGGCLPKDVKAFRARSRELGITRLDSLLGTVEQINEGRREDVVARALAECGGSVLGCRIAILGASFKPLTDDLRESPAINLARRLYSLGAEVSITDPVALHNVRARYPELDAHESVAGAIAGADLVVLATEWSEYGELDPAELVGLVARATVIDARNALDGERWSAAGWLVHRIGRPSLAAERIPAFSR